MAAHKRWSFPFSFCLSMLFSVLLVAVAVSWWNPGSISISVGAESDSENVVPNLPFGDINVVILTDVHSWLGSHRRQEPYYDADLGNVLSFWERLKNHCDGYGNISANTPITTVSAGGIRTKPEHDGPASLTHRDIFFVNNGDFVDGTGLSQTVDGDNNPAYLIPLLEKMPYDAVNVGNHELYSKKNIDYMTRPGGYVDWWGDRYLTSNIHKVDVDSTTESKVPLGNRYKILQGRSSRLLVFGFLYNMRNAARGAGIEIEKVQTTVEQQWFLDALAEEDYDAILVLAHMDLVDPLVGVIRSAIRDSIGDDMPLVFVTGHTHYRGIKQLDDLALTFEAGRYMDTVGFVSFPMKKSLIVGHQNQNATATTVFGHRFLDANRKVLFEDTLGYARAEDGETEHGKALSEFIDDTRTKLGLEQEVGCAPRSYFVDRHIDAPDSLWGLYRDQVVPKIFSVHHTNAIAIEDEATEMEDDLPTAMLLSKDSWRYDLYSSASLVVDDVYSIAPFNDTVVHLGTFTAEAILEANQTLNHHKYDGDGNGDGDGDVHLSSRLLPYFILIGNLTGSDSSVTTPVATTKYHLYTHEFGAEKIQRALERIAPSEKVEIRKTEFTSSLIWLAFVEQYWSCDDTVGKLPSWFPNHPNDPNSIPNREENGLVEA